jgi:cytochrome c peroxidase
MHDLQVERFVSEAPRGPMKTFTLGGVKERPRYLHDGRCLTLEDTVESFNLALGLQLSADEKRDLVAFVMVL